MIAAGITYWIYRTNFGIGDLFSGLGFPDELFSLLLPIVFLVLAVLAIWKFKLKGLFLLLGIGLIVVSFTDLVYEKGIVIFQWT